MKSMKAKKAAHLAVIKEHLQSYSAVVMISYDKLPNEKSNQFRDQLCANDNKMLVIKNNIASLALEGSQDNAVKSNLHGSNMLIFGNDVFELIKTCDDFIKSLNLYPKAKLSIMAGILDGSILEESTLTALKKIPSKESLYSGLITTILYPVIALTRVLELHSEKSAESTESTESTDSSEVVEKSAQDQGASEISESKDVEAVQATQDEIKSSDEAVNPSTDTDKDEAN